MARYTGPVCRLCRREGKKLFLKGSRCYTEKCSFERRRYPPGQHGQRRGKLTEYGIRLREKQKLKRIFGLTERQFRRYFDEADRRKGVTGENLLVLLERRLDNVVFRLGFASTRAEARQFVRHGHIRVNGRRVDIPSFLVKEHDVIEVNQKSCDLDRVRANLELAQQRVLPDWLEVDQANLSGRVKSLPSREMIDLPVREQLIVEFYSR